MSANVQAYHEHTASLRKFTHALGNDLVKRRQVEKAFAKLTEPSVGAKAHIHTLKDPITQDILCVTRTSEGSVRIRLLDIETLQVREEQSVEPGLWAPMGDVHADIGRDIVLGYFPTTDPVEFAVDGCIPHLVWMHGDSKGLTVRILRVHR